MEPEWALSPVPTNTLEGVPVVLGIDEAGRGPVLGPMVYACAYWAEHEEAAMRKMGFDDSKVLSEARREGLFAKMQSTGRVGWATMSISALHISTRMLRRSPYSLNAISHDAAAELVRHVLDQGVNVVKVYVDTVGDAAIYESKLTRAFQNRIAFTVSKKADSLFKTVSAASIAAKVTRDWSLKAWVFEEPALQGFTAQASRDAARELKARSSSSAAAAAAAASAASRAAASAASAAAGGGDDGLGGDYDGACEGGGAGSDEDGDGEERPAKRQRAAAPAATAAAATPSAATIVGPLPATLHPATAGSGYPGDALTKAWLRRHLDGVFGWPSVLRFSWAPAKDLLEKEGVPFEWEEEDNANPAAKWGGGGGGGAGAGGGEGAGGASQARLLSFFSREAPAADAAGGGSRTPVVLAPGGKGRPLFVRKRRMEHVLDL